MTARFHTITRLAGIALAGFALLAAGELPQLDDTAQIAPAIAYQTPTLSPDIAGDDSAAAPTVEPARPAHLAALVAQVRALPDVPLNADARCLARAVFFEARGEPLEGQLAVAQVILNRVASGRFADSVCGVIDQPGQFSFARRAVATRSPDYATARAIAVIAQAQRWLQVAPRAMAFHAARVHPGWGGMARVARIGNHVFYR